MLKYLVAAITLLAVGIVTGITAVTIGADYLPMPGHSRPIVEEDRASSYPDYDKIKQTLEQYLRSGQAQTLLKSIAPDAKTLLSEASRSPEMKEMVRGVLEGPEGRKLIASAIQELLASPQFQAEIKATLERMFKPDSTKKN
ncbi:MAG TPA: hypothetical protein GXX40_08705 [Firmicutes bacterium]|nr:hypothetical protein [Bacillota bacterium]